MWAWTAVFDSRGVTDSLFLRDNSPYIHQLCTPRAKHLSYGDSAIVIQLLMSLPWAVTRAVIFVYLSCRLSWPMILPPAKEGNRILREDRAALGIWIDGLNPRPAKLFSDPTVCWRGRISPPSPDNSRTEGRRKPACERSDTSSLFVLTLLVAGSWLPLLVARGRAVYDPPLKFLDLFGRFSKFKRHSISLNVIYI